MSKQVAKAMPARIAGAMLVVVAAFGLALSSAQAETKKYGGHWVGSNGGHGKFGRKIVREPGYSARTTKVKSHNGRTYTDKRKRTWDRDEGTYAYRRHTELPSGKTIDVRRRATRVDDGTYYVESQRRGRDGEVHGWSGTITRDQP